MFPDIEQLVIGYLNELMDERALTDLPADLDEILPVNRVTKVSGDDDGFRLDHPVVDIDTFGKNRAEAFNLARRVQALVLFELPAVTRPGGVVTAVSTIVGPRWLPDPNTALRRVGATYQFFAHAPIGA